MSIARLYRATISSEHFAPGRPDRATFENDPPPGGKPGGRFEFRPVPVGGRLKRLNRFQEAFNLATQNHGLAG